MGHSEYSALQRLIEVWWAELWPRISSPSSTSTSIIFNFNTSAGSAFQRLATDIKSKKGQEHNVYFNFMLTKRRSHLLFEVRKLKQNKDIFKYYSDEDGNISMKVNQNDKKSEKLTNIRTKNSSMLRVLSVDELHEKVQELKQ